MKVELIWHLSFETGLRDELHLIKQFSKLLREQNGLDETLAISTELGMRPLMERVLSRRGDPQSLAVGFPAATPSNYGSGYFTQ